MRTSKTYSQSEQWLSKAQLTSHKDGLRSKAQDRKTLIWQSAIRNEASRAPKVKRNKGIKMEL